MANALDTWCSTMVLTTLLLPYPGGAWQAYNVCPLSLLSLFMGAWTHSVVPPRPSMYTVPPSNPKLLPSNRMYVPPFENKMPRSEK